MIGLTFSFNLPKSVDEVCWTCQRFPENKDAPDKEYMEQKERDHEKLKQWNQWAKNMKLLKNTKVTV